MKTIIPLRMVAIASNIGGNDRVTSTSRMITVSANPPRNPASAPKVAPIAKAIATTVTAMGNEWRAPCRVRLRTSRPSASVPSQCSQLGGCRRRPTISNGS